MKYAEVAVNAPVAGPRTFTYSIPSHLAIQPGCAVWVPFGPRVLQGVVFNLLEQSPVEQTRDILDVIGDRPLITEPQIEIARWIAEYYLAPYFEAAYLMLPPAFEQRTLTLMELSPEVPAEMPDNLTPNQKKLFSFLLRNGRAESRQLKKVMPQKYISSTIRQMERKKLVQTFSQLQDPRIKPKTAEVVRLLISRDDARREAGKYQARKHAPAKAALLNYLLNTGEPVAKSQARKALGISDAVVRGLVKQGLILSTKTGPDTMLSVNRYEGVEAAQIVGGKKGDKDLGKVLAALSDAEEPVRMSELLALARVSSGTVRQLEQMGFVAIEEIGIRRDPLAHRRFNPVVPPELTPDQQRVWATIEGNLGNGYHTFLLHGVTGSGKTEIYLRALKETVSSGKKAIVIVPEIALTPQTIERFAARFPGRVAVLHSKLSPGEQYDEWYRIRDGEFDVVIGSRGAVFAPQPELGLIVIDEEHEWTYKQHDKIPLYHARDVALKLAQRIGATVILGSATPDLESYYHTERGDYELLELPERVCSAVNGFVPSLPRIEVVDLRSELKSGNRSIFSRSLARAIEGALDAREQAILFLNRRGAASLVQCRDCGYVMTCRRCDVALTYHPHEKYLICHLCNYRVLPPTACSECGSVRIKYLGIGTQKVEEETARAFPRAKLIRWDRDVTKGKHSHEQILKRFQDHEADILIGTQMVAKGLDIPMVTVVGVISADIGLHLPDFRAGERTFQLLSQVTGRAGRGLIGGQAIIQTYTPDHYAIEAAARQNYRDFYETEIPMRKKYGYPPFSRLVTLVYVHTNENQCEDEAQRMVHVLREERDSQGLANLTVIGPTPAFTPRIRGHYRWQVIVRGPEPVAVVSKVDIPQGWSVDVDPVGLT